MMNIIDIIAIIPYFITLATVVAEGKLLCGLSMMLGAYLGWGLTLDTSLHVTIYHHTLLLMSHKIINLQKKT